MPAEPGATVQLETGTLVVLFVEHVVVVNPLPELAADGVQLATGVLVATVVVEHVVAIKLFPAVGEAAVQEATNVGPVATDEQVNTPAVTQGGATGEESSVLAS